MSDEPRGTEVESETRPAAAHETPAAAPATPTPPAPEPDDDAVEVDGKGHMVPVAVVGGLRKDKADLKAELETAKAAQAEDQRFRQSATPVLQALQQRPDLIQALQSGQPVAAPAAATPATPAPDPAMVELAQALDIYDKDGNPDVKRAARAADVLGGRVDARVQEAVQPLAARTAESGSRANYQQLLNQPTNDGKLVDPEIFNYWWQALGADNTQDPNVAMTAWLQSVGHHQATGKPMRTPQTPAGAPVVTEPAGGGRPTAMTMTDADRRIAKELGTSAKDYEGIVNTALANNGVLEDVG